MKTLFGAIAVVAGLALTPAVAQAGDTPTQLTFSVGRFDSSWLGTNSHMVSSTEGRLDLRFGTSLIPATDSFMKVRPWVGVEANADSGVWGGGGLLLDVPLGESFYVAPSFGVGLYSRGDSKKLGSALEFRSTLEGGYRTSSDMRIGAYVSHISNAGISDTNPGANELGVAFSLPIGSMF